MQDFMSLENTDLGSLLMGIVEQAWMRMRMRTCHLPFFFLVVTNNFLFSCNQIFVRILSLSKI